MTTAEATTHPALSPALHDEVITHLLETGGPAAVADLKGRMAEVQGRISSLVGIYASGQRSWPLREALPRIMEQVRIARTLRARLADMGRLGPPELVGGLVSDPAPSTETEEVYGLILSEAGQRFTDDLNRQIPVALSKLKAELAQIVADLGVTRDRHASRSHGFSGAYGSAHDGAFDRFAELVARRQQVEDTIARVTGDQSRATAVQAASVAKVITDAGGPDIVIKAVRESRLMAETYWPAHPDRATLDAQRTALAGIDAQLARLGGPDAVGSVADQLRADRETAAADVDLKGQAVDRELQGQIRDLVSAAVAGDEPARASIERDALNEPRAFPPGFADAINAAAFPLSLKGSDLLATVLSIGLPMTG